MDTHKNKLFTFLGMMDIAVIIFFFIIIYSEPDSLRNISIIYLIANWFLSVLHFMFAFKVNIISKVEGGVWLFLLFLFPPIGNAIFWSRLKFKILRL